MGNKKGIIMLKNYITIAIRNLFKHKSFSFINITGLAVGIAVCMLILLFVNDELSYDRFNEKYERIGRIALEGYFGGSEISAVTSCAPLAETLVSDFPEVETATRVRTFGYPVIRYQDKVFSEEKFFSADSTFFDVFTVEFIAGDESTALTQPNTMIITDKTARRYFGDENPIGKILNSDNRRDYEVVGVVKEFPENSHFHFDFLLALSTYGDSRSPIWLSNNYWTYFVLKEGTSLEILNKKLETDLVKYIAPQVEQATGASWEDMMASGARYQYVAQPMSDIHLYNEYTGDPEPQSDAEYVYIFSIIAIGILTIACINFMNLSTARSTGRAREVGMRKTLGSTLGQLLRQFLSESIIMSFIAVVIAAILVQLLLPLFNDIAGKNLSINFFSDWYVIPGLIIFSIIIGILAGSYPAFFLSSFKPVAVLGGKLKASSKGKLLRSGLVIFQFSISIVLFIGTFIVYNQLQYIQNKNLGYNKDQLIIIHKTDDIGRFMNAFRNDLKNIPNILSVTNTTSLPGYTDIYANAYSSLSQGGEGTQVVQDLYADYGFAETLQLEMAEGRFYSEDRTIDTTNTIVINETAIKTFQLDDVLGAQIVRMGLTQEQSRVFTVIGVVKDFHTESMHKKISPMVIQLLRGDGFGRYTAVRISSGDIQKTLEDIKNVWSKYAGNQTFEYTFYDDDFAKLYHSEQRVGKLFTTFSVLAIFVACLGLLGLAAYTTEQRTKEIGIRKVLGAEVTTILLLLSKEFAKWVLIANIIAWPVAYFLMSTWLQDYEYRTEMGWGIFIISGIAALAVAVITISSQTIKAAIANPVESLRYE
jgi:putative ABC transport system permease protein